MIEVHKAENRFIDYKALENVGCLEEKEIIIYGAGEYGKRAAEMLQQLGFSQYNFCDKDIFKQGMNLMNGKILSIAEVENKKDLLIIVAIKNENVRKEVEQNLAYTDGANFLSFFALKMIWKFIVKDYDTVESRIEMASFWYEHLKSRGDIIRDACKYPVLVYQGQKVGSVTVSKSLWNVGIKNAHLHHFFFKNDMARELIFGKKGEYKKYIESSNIFQFQNSEYVKCIKEKMKHKKIITLVRDPIAVDLAIIFQWMERGNCDRYFAEELKAGKTFLQSVSELMVKIQDHLFHWFDEELKELCGIDVFHYPFDKEKGYAIISENMVEVLLIKAEKLSDMTEVIRRFVNNNQFELINANVGDEKEYGHIYREIKKKLELPVTYVKHYYNNNPYMNHFYSEEEQEVFLRKWKRCIRKDERENYGEVL